MTDEVGTKPVFGATDPIKEGDYALEGATLVNHGGGAGSGSGGRKAQIKFEIHSQDLGRLLLDDVIGQRAFDVKFGKWNLGEGLTIANHSGHPDADGTGRCWIVLIVPENQQTKLAVLYSASLPGKSARLTLGRSSVTIQDMIDAQKRKDGLPDAELVE